MKKTIITLALLICAIPSAASFAGIVLPLSNDQFNTGWSVELVGIDSFDGSVFPGLLTVTDETPGAPSRRIVIEIDKVFEYSRFNDFGIGQTAALRFILTNKEAPDYTPTIVINDEKNR
jgi:hypothetical protein